MSLAISLEGVRFGDYQQVTPHYDAELQCVWYAMHSGKRPCFSPTLLADLAAFQEQVAKLVRHEKLPISYLVATSSVPGVFNLGGDLNLFKEHIEKQDRAGLMRYAKACIDVVYTNAVHLHLPLTTISLVQGSALGGGFEAAISSNVLIAERGTELGMPEILFNLFPGMGAYSLLARKLDMRHAEAMITSGRIYSAEELHEMGLVDVLAEKGEGEQAVRDFIRRHRRAQNGLRAISRVREYLKPLGYEELLDITEIWVDAALTLTPRDLRMMGKLVGAQNRLQQKHEQEENESPQLALV